MQEIGENIARIREEMAAAAARAGRSESEITLLAATKMNDAERVREAIRCGVDACGENRVQELMGKYEEHAYTGAPLHFIGHLQKNKAKYLVGITDLIQSVDSVELLQVLERLAQKQGIRQDILIEINIGGEESKSGIIPEQADEMAGMMSQFPHLCLRGFMTIPPILTNHGKNSVFFQKMQKLFVDIMAKKYDNTHIDCLSMGMSDDFCDAIEEGATLIRVGSRIFGARQYV